MYIFKYLKKKAQGLPMSTIVIIILVVIVLVAVGLIFFQNVTAGQVGFDAGNKTAFEGAKAFEGEKTPWT